MSVLPSMVHRSGDSLIVRSVVSGDALFGSDDGAEEFLDDDLPPLLEKDLPECKVKRNYSCNTCDFFTQNPRHYLYHLRDVHEEKVKIYECPNCLYASKHFQKLLRHTKMVHGTDNLEQNRVIRQQQQQPTNKLIKTTSTSYSSATSEETTMMDVDEEAIDDYDDARSSGGGGGGVSSSSTVFKCSVCPFTAKTRGQLNRHEREEHIKTKFFRCTKCSYATHMKARFTKHVKYHSMPMIKCDMCDFRTPYKWNLDRHCKNHNGRGAFRCSACNFTADIKQSLTVHEMNHHVPPVGQAAGLGVGRRRNKVGASDATAAEDAAARQQQQNHENSQVATEQQPAVAAAAAKPEITHQVTKKSIKASPEQTGSFGPDFIHPDDIIHHANGNVYIKNKCKLCNFKSAWASEMARHEKKVHNILDTTITNNNNNNNNSSTSTKTKKPTRPIPNLIPIPAQSNKIKQNNKKSIDTESEPTMSQEYIKDICAKSQNSALKDFASLFGSEDVFESNNTTTNNNNNDDDNHHSTVPDLIPATKMVVVSSSKNDEFKQKNASFFDKLKEKLMSTGAGGGNNLTCKCGHESKCLTELVQHQKTCSGGKDNGNAQRRTAPFISSSRCQYCRQRCKSSTDLYNHLQTCSEAIKAEMMLSSYDESENELKIDESQSEEDGSENKQPHPMENRVFVWNNIEAPMDVEMDDVKYEYSDDKMMDDNVSLDYSVRTQSPCADDRSESSFIDYAASLSNNNNNNNGTPSSTHHSSPITDKIPTHGNDISVAQHKRVFKCPHCSFWASTASRFHVHIVGHLNKKPFECSLCSYRSNWRWDITKHIKLKSVRDPQHETAKVLMTDETGRRNYTKYNKYLTEIHVSGNQSMETSGGSGTRPKNNERNGSPHQQQQKNELPKLTRAPQTNGEFPVRSGSLRPPPPLKAADGSFFNKNKRVTNAENKRTLFQCKKCNYRNASRDILLAHVKEHYSNQSSPGQQDVSSRGGFSPDDKDEASTTAKGHQAPFRCGHCNQVSNWKHVIQRHCRLKHSGDIRVVSNKNGQEKVEIEEQPDEPDHMDVTQEGNYKCDQCPYSSNEYDELQAHLPGHSHTPDSIMKCQYCTYFVNHKGELIDHLRLHGIPDPEEFINKMAAANEAGEALGKRFKCFTCPYVTNSKSQYTYHKQFHRPRGGQYTCTQCTYNVSKRHLLHQHLKVHGINITPQKQTGDVIDLDEISDEIEEITTMQQQSGGQQQQNFEAHNFPDIPLVWVSKGGKFSKMFKCRYCPHVNLRKVNIQEHEKMHGVREKNPNSSRSNDVEHRCTECNYICNNAGVLSSHSKVHQGLCGTVHCLVDQVKSDEEQIRELSRFLNPQILETINLDDGGEATQDSDNDNNDATSALYFCKDCPARFLKENEFNIHNGFHGIRLFYKCDHCSYSARQKPHLLAHNNVHSNEYQNRTRVLQTIYPSNNNQPEIYSITDSNGDSIWVVPNDTTNKWDEQQLDRSMKSSSSNVPLSGTELFQQKSEAQQKQAALKAAAATAGGSSSPKSADPQFGTLMHGNPNFIYPTYLKNGRMKEKRYKCHKCPSAFEKREQYRIHLNLHGSKQRYNCQFCDYSVKYYANYVQHLKKHKMNSDAIAARDNAGMEMEDEDINEEVTINNNDEDDDDDRKSLSVGDQQAYNILQQRLLVNTSPIKDNNNSRGGGSENVEEKKTFTCTNCPYNSHRKDAVENHQKRHTSVSGVKSNYMCEHCDYSVPQVHFLREHTRLHFLPNNKINNSQIDGYMVCDNLKLTSVKCEKDNEEQQEKEENENNDENIIFEENEQEKKFLPELSGEVTDRFNNNDGEKQFVNLATGEVAATDLNGDNNSSNKMDDS